MKPAKLGLLSLKLVRAVPMSAINFLAYEQVYALWNGAA